MGHIKLLFPQRETPSKYRILFYQRPALISSPTTGTKGMYHFTPILTAIILIQLSQNFVLEASRFRDNKKPFQTHGLYDIKYNL